MPKWNRAIAWFDFVGLIHTAPRMINAQGQAD